MRQLFICLVIILIVTVGYADISFTVNGVDVGVEYTAYRAQRLWIGVYAQDMPGTGQFYAYPTIIDLTGVQQNGSFTGNHIIYSPPAIPTAQSVYHPYEPWSGEYWELINSDGSDTISGNGLIAEYEYNCDAEGNVEIRLYGPSGPTGYDPLIIHQLPPIDPVIEVSSDVITINTTTVAGNPAPQDLLISNDGVGTLNWTVTESSSWLTVSPSGGSCTTETDAATLTVDITGLTPGTYSCDLTVSDPNAVNNPYTVTVYLNIGGINIPGKGYYSTIQDAINAADNGDTVIVPDGTYKGIGNRDIDFLGKGITVQSENGPENCIIDAEWATPAFYFHNSESASSVLQGLTITHGQRANEYWDGGGIFCENSSPKIKDCILIDNGSISKTFGGGIGCLGSSATIERCIFKNNKAYRGGGISSRESYLDVSNCLIIDNNANASEYGGGIYNDGGFDYEISKYTNCTVVGNSAGRGGAIDIITSTAIITNCIFWDNLPSEITYGATGTATVTHSDIKGGFDGTGNIDVDPQFVAPGDYHLSFGSLCIDRGTNSPPSGLSATDLEGTTRPLDGDGDGTSTTDIGAYEFVFNPGEPIIGVAPINFYFSCPEGGPDPNTQSMSIFDGGGGVLNWQISENANWLTVTPDSGSSTGEIDNVVLSANSTGLTADMYNCTLSVFNADDPNDIRYVNIDFRVGPTLLVPSQYSTMQDAVDTSFDGDEIIVANGVYTGNGNRDIDTKGKAITVRSEDSDPNLCIIDCQGTSTENHRGFYIYSCEGRNTVIDGFTITNGYMGNGSTVNDGDGGGMMILNSCTSPTIKNCIITQNTGSVGGGISCATSTPLIKNCVISDNTAYYDYGGGISCTNQNERVIIENCVVKHNTAKYGAGGIHIRFGESVISNSIVVKNHSIQGDTGGIYSNWNSSSIQNCTIADNDGYGLHIATSGDQIVDVSNTIIWDQIYGSTSILTTDYCNILSGRTGTGNINADPSFVDPNNDDYHIAVNSICVDTGDPDFDPAPYETDIDGQIRVMNERIDIGADEISDMITDLDDNGSIDISDLVTLMDAWLTQPGDANWNPNYDANKDNIIDGTDFSLLSKYWLTDEDLSPPTVPANIIAIDTTTSTVSLVWDESTDNITVAGYMVYRDGVYIGWSATSEYTDIDLDPLTSYAYTVLAYDLAYNTSPMSSICMATTQ